jgi:hypothetical protein
MERSKSSPILKFVKHKNMIKKLQVPSSLIFVICIIIAIILDRVFEFELACRIVFLAGLFQLLIIYILALIKHLINRKK